MTATPEEALAVLPDGLRSDLLDAFAEIVGSYREHRWGASELDGGKLCEAAYSVVVGWLEGGDYPLRGAKPNNFAGACAKLADTYPKVPGSHSARVLVPRVLTAVYDIRNNRGVGHVGGDVNPNQMDATFVLYSAKWIVAELVRMLHSLTTEEATEIVDGLIAREVAWVWTHHDKKRVLRPGMTWKDQTLVLLLTEPGDVSEDDLVRWLEHKRPSTYRKDVLRPLHAQRSIEYDGDAGTVRLLPPGVEAAEGLVEPSMVT